MREIRSLGSVRGAAREGRPYREGVIVRLPTKGIGSTRGSVKRAPDQGI